MHAPVPRSSATPSRRRYTVIAGALGVIVGLAFSTVGSAQSAPPDEPPSTTEPSAPSEPPVTERPVTETPVSEPPVSEPPVSEPPVTEPPVTEPPVTEPPTTTPAPAEPAPVEPPTTATLIRLRRRVSRRLRLIRLWLRRSRRRRPSRLRLNLPPTRRRRSRSRTRPVSRTLDGDGNTVLGAYPTDVRRAASVGDQYIVQVADDDVLADVRRRTHQDAGVTITNTLQGDFVGFVAPLDASVADGLRSRDGVVAVERDERIELAGTQPNPPWNLDRIDQRRRPLNHRYSYRCNRSWRHGVRDRLRHPADPRGLRRSSAALGVLGLRRRHARATTATGTGPTSPARSEERRGASPSRSTSCPSRRSRARGARTTRSSSRRMTGSSPTIPTARRRSST